MSFRIYDNENVKDTYMKCRSLQTVEHVKYMRQKYLTFDTKLNIWDMFEKLNVFVDASDPDCHIPNMHHLFQTAEGVRLAGLPEWLQVTALLHDLGKIMYLWGCDEDGTTVKEQWSLVGDTFIVGCQIPKTCVHPEFNVLNSDMHISKYNTKYGIYKPNCGLDKCLVSFGHDEYLYHMLKFNKCTLPEKGLYIIRYHSLYPWHQEGEYEHLMDDKDKDMLPEVKKFNKFDLYTKRNEKINIDELKPYYKELLMKFLPSEELYF